MSILEKKLTPAPQRRSHGRLYIILAIVVILVAVLLLFTNVNDEIAFIVHFVTPPKHFTYSGHSDYVSAVAWSPDGKRIASASGDQTAQVWDASDGSHVLTYRGHSSDVLALAWSPNGQYIATGSVDTTVQIWNSTSGARVYTYRGHTNVVSGLAWSPDGQRIASISDDGTLQVWDAFTGQHVVSNIISSPSARGEPAALNAVAFSPNGKYLAIGGAGQAILLDAATAKIVGNYGPQGGQANAVAFSPDGKYLAVGRDNLTVQVLDVAAQTSVYTYTGHIDGVFTVAWSPDGKRIASGGADGTVQVWDALTGSHEYTYRGHLDFYLGHFTSGQQVETVAWSPDGKYIASGGTDNTVQVWQPM
ncbi:MAG TPA: WD40 repeat domain-containing protein [Ktedonobacteraceae bacterium]|nr:WD40 repeat domain-containing protein [Ktedonobacteraceae bacterium]